jgi:hypothetical protein
MQRPKIMQVNAKATPKNFESSLTCSKIQKLRHLSFKPTVSVRPIPHIDDISEKIIHDVWFSKRDFEEMKKSFSQTLRAMSQYESDLDNEEHCFRGLEYRTREGELERRRNKWNALNAVLDEQDRQKSLGIGNDKLLCQIYKTESNMCQQQALLLGKKDEMVAKAVYFEIEQDKMNMYDTSIDSECSEEDFAYRNVYRVHCSAINPE